MANSTPEQQSDIKLLIKKGLEQGYLTYAEVNDHLPDDVVDPEQIEDIIGVINGMGIEVYEVAPDAETLLLSDASRGNDEDTASEDAAAAQSALEAEGDRKSVDVGKSVSVRVGLGGRWNMKKNIHENLKAT